MLLCWQVFIGEGWHSIMQQALAQKSQVLCVFFVFYVLVVGTLFSNLFVGIVINIFQDAEARGKTSAGEVDLVFSWQVEGMSMSKKNLLYRHLGYLASLLHAPVMKVLLISPNFNLIKICVRWPISWLHLTSIACNVDSV